MGHKGGGLNFMGYFSNGSEGDTFTTYNCDLCVHALKCNCPVWGLHLKYNYNQFDKSETGNLLKLILDRLIPRDEDGFCRRCTMFHSYTEEELHESRDSQMREAGFIKSAPWIEEYLNNKKECI